LKENIKRLLEINPIREVHIFWKIATVEFNEIVKGMYISEDKKGLVVEILDLTGLDKNVELGELSVEVTLKIEECVQGYADKIECIVFDNRKYCELDLGDGFEIQRL
jgi:hypothetical protein